MRKWQFRITLFIFCFVIFQQHTLANEQLKAVQARPKVGLCLSGGGAKGLAYVGLLKLIDSLDIKIDYITGTSMGSIVGGLYAIGYKGHELEQIALKTPWNYYLSNSISLKDISIEEKDEYGRYMLELNSNGWTPDLPIGVINGQNILAFLNDLTFRVHHISNFRDFPIPFQCVAVDIVTGKPVVLDKGSLALAMRTSMSIPTAFSPIDTGNMLLVDGGLFKNFPVEYVEKMGAQYIIGANTSGTLLKKREIKTLVDMLDQTTSFSIAADYEKQKNRCDMLIDYNEALKAAGIGTLDFGKSKEILAIGEKVARQFLPQLIVLAEQQREYKIKSTDTTQLNKSDTLCLQDIQLTLDKSTLEGITKNKIRFKDYNNISKSEIHQTINTIYGTRYFDRVYYYVENKNDEHRLIIKTEKTKKLAYKLGLHYDTEMSAGIIINMTARNVIQDASRLLLSLDISDNPKIRAAYQFYIGNKGFFFSTNHFFQRVKQAAFYERLNLGSYKHLYFQSDVYLHYASRKNSLISMGAQFKWGNLKPSVQPQERPEFFRSIFTLTRRPFLNAGAVVSYQYNTLDKPIFPTKGIQAYIQGTMVLAGKTTSTIHTEYISVDSFLNVTTKSEDTSFRADFHPYMKWFATYQHIFKLHRKVSLEGKIQAGMIWLFHSTDNLAATQADAFYLGGIEQRERERISTLIPFQGNHELYAQQLNFMTASVMLQYEPVKNLFFQPQVAVLLGDDGNIAAYDGSVIIRRKNGFKPTFVHSQGLTIAYKTPIGPVKLNLSKASNYSKPIFYFSLGYRF